MAEEKKVSKAELYPNLIRGITKENASERARQSIEARRRKKEARIALRESLDILLTKALKKGELVTPQEIQDMANVEDLNVDVQTAMAIAVLQRALMGDVQAAQFVRDTVGEKPTDKVQVDQSLTIEAWAKNHKPKL